jgi:hypothetical protein
MSSIEPFTDLVYGQAIRQDAQGFWLEATDGKDWHFCPPGAVPAMLEGHPVTVILSGEAVCLVANHATGQTVYYRPLSPEGPYLPTPKAGCSTFLLLAGMFFFLATFASGFAAGSPGTGSFLVLVGVIGFCFFAFLFRQQQQSYREAQARNQELDRQLEGLADVSGRRARPNRFRPL